jgi:cytochrome c oxidase subunit 4
MSHHHNQSDGHTRDPHADHGHGEMLGHILPLKVYLGVFAALVVLTVVTVQASYIDTGPAMHLTIAMVIASVKAGLVAMFFMHLKYEQKITWLYAGFPLILLAILIGGLFIDNPYRIKTVPVGSQPEVQQTVSAAAH